MDWQHLIMNGENLAEYAALLAAEGLLGHQHANSGWGTFDDDNMVGATAFMETLELAIELRRAGYGDNGERLGFDLYPYTEDAVGAVKRSVLQWRFIDGVAAKIDDGRAAQGAAGEGRSPRVRARVRRARRVTVRSIGLDVGTSGVKGIAIDADGAVLAVAEEPYPLSTPQPGWAEQDPEDWWRASQAALARLPEGPVGLSGQMHGLVVLDAADRVLRPAILWNDQRTGAECAEIEAARRARAADRADRQPGAHRVHRAEAPLAPPARARDVRADPPHPAAEGLRPAPADRRARDRRRRRLGDAPLRRRRPPLVDGGLRGARDPARLAAARARVDRDRRRGRPGRGARSAWASPRQARSRSSSARRASSSRRCLRTRPTRRRACTRLCHAVPGTWHAMGVMLSAAGSAAWLRDALGAPFAELDAEAERWEPGAEGLLFAPYLAGERTPYPDPDARGAFTGLSLRHDRGALWRAMLEGVAFGLRDSLELLHELGVRPEVGRVSGGGARSDLWLRIVASVLQLPLERMETDEGSAFGAALLAGIRAGTFADASEAVARCVRARARVDPVWDYDEQYRRFRSSTPR